MKLIKPKALHEGDKVAALTLSWGGPGTFPHRYEIGKKQLEDAFKVKVVETSCTLKSAEWIHNNPKARADDLMAAFSDPTIKGIVSTIGGDESIRILPYLDLNIIRNNSKVFLGYSDTTSLHFACLKAGITSYYGPSIMAGFAENQGLFDYMSASLKKTIFDKDVIGEIKPNSAGWTVEHLDWANPENQKVRRKLSPPTGPRILQGSGKVRGHLLGGCIEVLEMLKGTEFWPSLDQWRGAILFLETSEEAPSVDYFTRWIRNYGSQGILGVLNGIILARPGGQIPQEKIHQYDAALQQVVTQELGLKNLPLMTQLDFGHTDPMFTIPYGVVAEIDCDKNMFSITESGVS